MKQLFEDEVIINKVHTIKKQEAETIYNVTGSVRIYQENKSKGNKLLLNKYLQMDYSSSWGPIRKTRNNNAKDFPDHLCPLYFQCLIYI